MNTYYDNGVPKSLDRRHNGLSNKYTSENDDLLKSASTGDSHSKSNLLTKLVQQESADLTHNDQDENVSSQLDSERNSNSILTRKANKRVFKKREKQKPPEPAKVFCMASVVREKVDWLWSPYIPLGKITSVEGDPGVGKSSLTTAIAAAVSRGLPLPGDNTSRRPENVLMLTAEDGLGDTLAPLP